ncbi:hypothetical protein ACFFVB_09065 [Formosa undariae]|uniref:Multidrug transporter n=1 Tax=Formosa undariae TaxID=1325436 RepID=A0ABV5F269_9FLAO
MKKTILGIAVIAGLIFTSCSSNDDNPIIPSSSFELDANNFQGDIEDGEVTLSASETYILTGPLVVKSGAELFIPAGTTIKTDPNGASTSMYIAVERGAKIYIDGQANNPVVMTSGKATQSESDWGGLIICGDAPVNTGSNGDSEVGNLAYGGDNEIDDSGRINYLRIEYTGSKFSATKEFNGVSFFGVGSGTQVSNIFAYESGDDGIEFFGGTVNASNLAIVNAYDDSLDFADGYSGTITNVYISGISKAGIEGSNNGDNDVATPMTNAKLINVSIVKGDDAKFVASEQAINFKEGGGMQTYTNLFVSGIDTFAKLDEGSGATARIEAGEFMVNGIAFVTENNLTTDYVASETGAGNGADMPDWANEIE